MTLKKFNLPLVNAHTHAAMVGFRGVAEDLPLDRWLKEYIWVLEAKKVKPRFVYEQTKKAIVEMRENGIGAFCDMYFFEEEVARAAEELDMPVMIGECLLDFPTPSAKNVENGIARTEKLLIKYRDSQLVTVAVAPHSIYAVSGETLIRAKKLAKKYGAPYHIHLAETKREFDDCKKKHNLTPVAYLEKLGLLDAKTILAHCVWLTKEDIYILAKRKAKVVHCPLSNLKLGSGISPVTQLLEKGVVVSLGTDGAASSNRLDIWEAGKFAALLQKGITNDPTALSAKTAIEMMTLNGMETLGIEKLGGKNLLQIKKILSEINDYSFLYNLQSGDVFGS